MWTSENLADMGVTGIYNLLLSGNVAGDLYKFECFGVSADCRDRDYAITLGNITTSDGCFPVIGQSTMKGSVVVTMP